MAAVSVMPHGVDSPGSVIQYHASSCSSRGIRRLSPADGGVHLNQRRVQDISPDIRQSAFALVGDLARAACSYLSPALTQVTSSLPFAGPEPGDNARRTDHVVATRTDPSTGPCRPCTWGSQRDLTGDLGSSLRLPRARSNPALARTLRYVRTRLMASSCERRSSHWAWRT